MQTLELEKTNEQGRIVSWSQAHTIMQLLTKQKENQKKPTESTQFPKQTKETDTITA